MNKDSINRVNGYLIKNGTKPAYVTMENDKKVMIDDYIALSFVKDGLNRINKYIKEKNEYPAYVDILGVKVKEKQYRLLFGTKIYKVSIIKTDAGKDDEISKYFKQKFGNYKTFDDALRLVNNRGYSYYYDDVYSNKACIDRIKTKAGINCLSGNNKIVIRDKKDKTVFSLRIDDFVNNYDYNNYEVPTVNLETNKMEWKSVLNAFQSGVDTVYSIKFSKGLIVEATADHKFIKSHGNKALKNEPYIPVSDFMNGKKKQLLNNTNLYSENEHKNYYWSALFGFFLGDGNIRRERNGYIVFHVSKHRKVKYLNYLLEKLGLEYTYTFKETTNYANGESYSFYLKDKIYPNLSKSELVTYYKKELNYKGLLEGLINSDGMIRLDIGDSLRLGFSNTNKDIFDLYVLACLCCGIRASYSIHHDNRSEKYNDVYQSASFGENVIKLLSEITLFDEYKECVENCNKNPKKYKDISFVTPKSVTEIGEMPVYNLTIEDNHNYMAGVNGFVLLKNCTDSCQLFWHVAKSLNYKPTLYHVKCSSSGGGHVYLRLDKGDKTYYRDPACVLSNNGRPITDIWCKAGAGGVLLDKNPKWFMNTVNR